ncbi:MAG: uroporphyrinogen-III synthase [Kiritimatiellae bacterium]|nr:uroporphyrinogen-III synthase [Kiritimatiellia bacterium]
MGRIIKVGARGSALSMVQTKSALRLLARFTSGVSWRIVPLETPGDRDLSTPLEKSAPDFFTRDLDDAVRAGAIDCAIHSAKDLPGYSEKGGAMVAPGLDWFWLPEREDPRDCWVFTDGLEGLDVFKNVKGLRIGISSARRRAYAKRVFPKARLLPVRGTIDSRLRQLAEGGFDALLMALAGVKRLYGVEDGTVSVDGHRLRLEPIPMEELPPPEAQGVLAVTFRIGDRRFQKLRQNFIKAVRFVSAGVGDAGLCTIVGLRDIASADVVLYDDLMGRMEDFRDLLPSMDVRVTSSPAFIPVGKRCGAHSMRQADITDLICDEARKGRRVVRLKGGDAGLFGRLAEEVDALAGLRMPFLVRPGVSALTAATTGTGMLLTRRGVSRGFTAFTPRSTGGDMPLVMFMAVRVAAEESRRLIDGGSSPDTPCAMVFDAAGPREKVWQGTLELLASPRSSHARSAGELEELAGSGSPGLFIVGQAATRLWPRLGMFGGRRVLVTCSDAVQAHVRMAVEDGGGRAIAWPMIELRARRMPDLSAGRWDAIVLTSPSAVRLFFEACNQDRRRLPRFFTCGAGTDAELRRFGVSSDVMPATRFSAEGLVDEVRKMNLHGWRILRLRSAKAGTAVADALRAAGASVADRILYDNVPVRHVETLPPFDDVHFASASAVEAFLAAYGEESLRGRRVLVMGTPTRAALPQALRRRACIFETFAAVPAIRAFRRDGDVK